jgi:hypothetical protein
VSTVARVHGPLTSASLLGQRGLAAGDEEDAEDGHTHDEPGEAEGLGRNLGVDDDVGEDREPDHRDGEMAQ